MSSKATRIKAAECAARACAGREVELKHLWSIMALFENYIDLGAEECDRYMKLGIITEAPVVKLGIVR
jgi:hypothetical protein